MTMWLTNRTPGPDPTASIALVAALIRAAVPAMVALTLLVLQAVPLVPAMALVGAALGAVAGAGVRVLLGRLRRGARVPRPLCEIAVALAWAAVGAGWAIGVVPGRWVPALLGLAWFGVATAAVDLRHRRIPDALTLPALPVALACAVPLGGPAVLMAAAGAALAFGGHALLHLLAPRAMGMGDVKLAAPLGAVLGATSLPAVPVAAVLAALLTAAVGVGGLLTGAFRRGTAVPHGPSMVVATAVVTACSVVGRTGIPPP
jgi:leader peptidase (prepilin peptidase)/N-methyltransferase